MGILTVLFAPCHHSQQSGCKQSALSSFCNLPSGSNDVISKLSFVDKVYSPEKNWMCYNFYIKTSVLLTRWESFKCRHAMSNDPGHGFIQYIDMFPWWIVIWSLISYFSESFTTINLRPETRLVHIPYFASGTRYYLSIFSFSSVGVNFICLHCLYE